MKPSKKQFLSEVSKHKGSRKYTLSLMTDLASAVAEMKSFNLEGQYSKAKSEYNEALSLFETFKTAADSYTSSYDNFSMDADYHWEAYEKARDIYFEVTSQLQDLGVDESPEISDIGNEIADAETIGQKAFEQTQSDFDDHNELVEAMGGQ
tara:strand:- start:4065 stop:4517 length:453 start_codon:yes stop_codon:yes gene_type:complete